MSNSIIRTHTHENLNVLKEFSESPDSVLLYKGKPIVVTSKHETEVINTENGVHGLRYYDKKLQCYFNDKWNDIATGGSTITVDKDIILSPTANNVLVKYSNGYYVPGFLISHQSNNALVKYSDGYYVPKIPVNNATLDDIDNAIDIINNNITQNNNTINQKYDILTTKVNQIASSVIKSNTHYFTGNLTSLSNIIDISTLYNETVNVLLNIEIMIFNKSDKNQLIMSIIENNIETFNNIIKPKEVQKYKLSNTSKININIQGEYEIYLYVQYA